MEETSQEIVVNNQTEIPLDVNNQTKMQLDVFTPNEFPIGVLSSNHISPFSMTGKERRWGYPELVKGTWKSVTQFVYVNMFSNVSSRSQMKDSILFGFSTMVAIQTEIDNLLFEEYIKKGFFQKINENKNLLYKLSTIKDYNLIYKEIPYIVDVLNHIRYPKNKIFYYYHEKQPPEAIFVSLSEVANVLHGIEIEISKGGFLNDNETYSNLIKWSKNAKPESGMIDWIDLENLVPLARLRLRNKKIIQDIEIFKNVLLNTFLDYILNKEYPYLEKTLYERARTQQLEQETPESIQSLKNQLYEIFLIGGNTEVHKQILQTIQNYQPQQFVLEPYPEKTNNRSFDSTKSTDSKTNISIDLTTIPELLPSYESMFSIYGKQYLTVIHYAYDMLIKQMLKIYPGLNMSTFDINRFKIEELPIMYADIRKEWTEKTLLVNNEAALEAKLKQHSSILHFLFQTDPYPILWEEVQDPILGVYDGTGKNMTGKHLMFLRETIDRKKVKNKYIYINNDLATNNILQLWLYKTSLYLRNILLLLDSPTTRDLEYLYSVHTKNVKQRPPNTVEKQILEQAGLTSAQIKVAFPMILVLASKQFGDEFISEIQICQSSFHRYIEDVKKSENYTNLEEEYDKDFQIAEQYLSIATENIKLAPGVTTSIFVESMLAGNRVQPDDTQYPAKDENVIFWSAAFSYFVVEEPTDSYLSFILTEKPNKISQNIKDILIPTVQNYKTTLKMRTGKKGGLRDVKNTPLEHYDTIQEGALFPTS